MQLIYKIEFNTTNLYFKHIIEDLIKEAKINGVCKQYKGFILIILEEMAENIENFFALLEKKLPVSIFIGKSYVVETYDESLEEIKDFEIKQNLSLLTNDAIRNIIEENNIDFLNDILKITRGGVSRFETHNGLKDYFLPNKDIREEFENKGFEVKLLITDITKLGDFFDINMKDFQLLCSIERPLVKLKFKMLKNANKEFSSTNFIYAKIPDDKETVLFSKALKEKFGFLNFIPTAHAEHSTETQAPFCKYYFPNSQIIEIVYGKMNFEELSKLIDFIFEDESNFLLISTDLSHFYTQEEANKLDNICLNAIAKRDLSLFDKGCEACGKLGVKAVIKSAINRDYKTQVLHYCTSYDRTKDASRVVGYTSVLIGNVIL